jgi:hypothetical protein
VGLIGVYICSECGHLDEIEGEAHGNRPECVMCLEGTMIFSEYKKEENTYE